MRSRSLLLALLLVGCSDPTAPEACQEGTYRLLDVFWRGYGYVQEELDGSTYRMTLVDGFVSGNGGTIRIRTTREADGEFFDQDAFVADSGQYNRVGDTFVLLVRDGSDVVDWQSGVHACEGRSLVLRRATSSTELEAVWVPE